SGGCGNMRWGKDDAARGVGAPARGGARGRWLMALLVVAALQLAACASATSAHVAKTATTSASPTAAAAPTTAPTAIPTVIAIQDLGAFRARFAAAITSKDWASVQGLLSPSFSFQAPKSGSHLLMPQSADMLQASYQAGNPWFTYQAIPTSQLCYAGPTPLDQVITFGGDNGHFLMVGLSRWNGSDGYWVAAWAYENPQNVQWDCSCGCIND
ncbi:MAG TPA: hypothetical protein VGR57_07320, partial [Ktedonobacterales bacterium]|nr:hypothetical protein [Ktedonobacterales bacterium]